MNKNKDGGTPSRSGLGYVLDEREKYMKEYGLFKFRLYPYKELEVFLSLNGEKSTLKKILTFDIEKYYQLINPPKENEWLMTHKEYGQTYLEFARGGYKMITKNSNTIYILNIRVIVLKPKSNEETQMQQEGKVEQETVIEQFHPAYIAEMITILQGYYSSIPIKPINIVIELSEKEYLQNSKGRIGKDDNDDKEFNIIYNRRQINGTYLLSLLYNNLPSKAFCSIALLNKDMYHIDIKNQTEETCYELRNLSKRISLISTTRFNPLFYYQPIIVKEEDNKKKLEAIGFKRQLKLLIRNIALMFGLANCIFYSCPMNGFYYLDEFDEHPLELCPICLRKVFSVLLSESDQLEKNRCRNAIGLYQRFDSLGKVLSESIHKAEFKSEVNWYKQRYDALTKII